MALARIRRFAQLHSRTPIHFCIRATARGGISTFYADQRSARNRLDSSRVSVISLWGTFSSAKTDWAQFSRFSRRNLVGFNGSRSNCFPRRSATRKENAPPLWSRPLRY